MTFCIKCGKEIPKGAEYCPNCGEQISTSVESEKSDYTGIGSVLILIGGIIAIISSIFSTLALTFMSFWTGTIDGWTRMPHMMGRWGMPMVFGGWITNFMVIGAIISIILGVIAIYACRKVRGGEVKNGGTLAIILGIIMLITMNWFAGLITLIGGILCYTSK